MIHCPINTDYSRDTAISRRDSTEASPRLSYASSVNRCQVEGAGEQKAFFGDEMIEGGSLFTVRGQRRGARRLLGARLCVNISRGAGGEGRTPGHLASGPGAPEAAGRAATKRRCGKIMGL